VTELSQKVRKVLPLRISERVPQTLILQQQFSHELLQAEDLSPQRCNTPRIFVRVRSTLPEGQTSVEFQFE
jgi:hypothetical protein